MRDKNEKLLCEGFKDRGELLKKGEGGEGHEVAEVGGTN